MLAEIPASLFYEECSVCRKAISITGSWVFEVGFDRRKNVPPWVFVGFMLRDKIDSEVDDNSTLDWLPIPSVVCKLASDRYPVTYLNLVRSNNNFHYKCYETKNLFLKHTDDKVKNHS